MYDGVSPSRTILNGNALSMIPPLPLFFSDSLRGSLLTFPHGTCLALSYFVVRVGDIVSGKELLWDIYREISLFSEPTF
jgi:hypothetical protein